MPCWQETGYRLYFGNRCQQLSLRWREDCDEYSSVGIYREKTGEKIEKDVIDAFMGFLGSVYAVGNMTSAAVTSRGGALDNWDAKLKNIHEKYIKEEKAWVDYVKTNKFECYFVDKDPRKEIIPFWSYGPSKLANATDKDWKEYFENAKRMIEERDKLKA